MKLWIKIAGACFSAFALSACAVQDVQPVNYTASITAAPVSEAGKAFKLEIADNRGVYRGRIGAFYDGWGNDTDPIRSTIPVRDIVRNALLAELKARNVSATDTATSILEVSITAMQNNFDVALDGTSARGIAVFAVRVIGADGTVHFQSLVSKLHKVTKYSAISAMAAQAVEGALAAALKSLFEDQAFIDALAIT